MLIFDPIRHCQPNKFLSYWLSLPSSSGKNPIGNGSRQYQLASSLASYYVEDAEFGDGLPGDGAGGGDCDETFCTKDDGSGLGDGSVKMNLYNAGVWEY